MSRPSGSFAGPYMLCDLLDNIQLSEDGLEHDIQITCVEFWDGNVYIGTSAGEVLHYVLLPAGTDQLKQLDFILASRLRPEHAGDGNSGAGVEQILLLPGAGKACILSNGTLNFYALPELSPAYGGTRRVPRCSWVGGVNDATDTPDSEHEGQEIMICDNTKIRIVRIGQKAVPVRAIQLGGCHAVVRRGDIACAADLRSYSLLEVVQQQAIPLFEVSSQQDRDPKSESMEAEQSIPTLPFPHESSHGTNASVPQTSTDAPITQRESESDADASSIHEPTSHQEVASEDANIRPPRTTSLKAKDTPPATSESRESSDPVEFHRPSPSVDLSAPRTRALRPHIVSPTPDEFLLTTGTSSNDEGVGIFVNLDGDVVRGTLQFSRYPEALIVDGDGLDPAAPTMPGQIRSEGYVLAVIDRGVADLPEKVVEIQRWDTDPSESPAVDYLEAPIPTESQSGTKRPSNLGLGKSKTIMTIPMTAIVQKLDLVLTRIDPSAHETGSGVQDSRRVSAETEFVKQMSQVSAAILVWSGSSVRWAVRTPTILHLDARLDAAISNPEASRAVEFVNRPLVEQVVGDLRDQESTDELQFISFKYLRQKASLLLFMDLVVQVNAGIMTYERDRRVTAECLVQGEVDPRLIIAVVPLLGHDLAFKDGGLYVQRGIADCVTQYLHEYHLPVEVPSESPMAKSIFKLAKDYLFHWRKKKGFGSITDEQEVFKSVDTALLHILLLMDSKSPPGREVNTGSRTELKALVTEGVECFDLAVSMIEQYQRLYVLSLLYMSRRQFAKVLETWKRIMEGEKDLGGELGNGEEEMRSFLKRRKDRALVQEYGCWLAVRNPKLGVQVFADDTSQVTFEPREAIKILKANAPDAVKDFIEHLVFDKKLPQFANDLIGYYLDFVVTELETSEASRSLLLSTNAAYKALSPPKPTYNQFVTDNGIAADWWRNRLRLLRLLGGSHETASQYDVEGIASRLEKHKEELVPETIVLCGRQGRHAEAIHLLTHGLGDFDTAISYCVLGGSGTYSLPANRARYASMPSKEKQMELFRCLLEESFRIDDLNERISQTSELLERFSSWFDIKHVLSLVPNSWSIDKISPFIESSLREMLTERNEALVGRALTSCANLTANNRTVEKIAILGPVVDRDPEKTVTANT